jgi:isopentenyl diphosphate isomerase/L-lactate dehydrogenase-like FMN-dependent dehydrogenase
MVASDLVKMWLKAMCLGAKGTYIGRAFLYGLGALGKEGVTKALRNHKNRS